jgi:cytochrome c oxidase cbb3-type subunit 4
MLTHTIMTILWFVAFIAVCVWAYSKKRKKSFDEAAQLPLEDDPQKENHHV